MPTTNQHFSQRPAPGCEDEKLRDAVYGMPVSTISHVLWASHGVRHELSTTAAAPRHIGDVHRQLEGGGCRRLEAGSYDGHLISVPGRFEGGWHRRWRVLARGENAPRRRGVPKLRSLARRGVRRLGSLSSLNPVRFLIFLLSHSPSRLRLTCIPCCSPTPPLFPPRAPSTTSGTSQRRRGISSQLPLRSLYRCIALRQLKAIAPPARRAGTRSPRARRA